MFGRGGGGGGRPVCKFFLEGRCKFGDGCKNEHPQSGGVRGRAGAFSGGAQQGNDYPYHLSADTIKIDLTTDKPQWPLSSYGPGRNAPLQLIEGELEQSPDEMRLLHYLAMARGNPQETATLEAQTAAKADEAKQKILNDLHGAIKFVIDGKDNHPNRIDLAEQASNDQGTPKQSQNPFGTAQSAPPSGFGQPAAPSAFGQPAAPAAAPGFGQPSTMGQQASGFGQPAPASTGFGQPSPMGQQPSGFGQPSVLGKPAAPGFGAPSNLGSGGPAFGQPSGIGQNSTGFGQPSQMGQKPAFGQPAFGQPSKPAFGVPSAPGGFSSGASPFAQPSSGGFSGGTPFGQTQPQQQNTPSPFSSAASQPSGFAQPGAGSTAFGQPSAFGAGANKPSPFATAAQTQQQQPSPFSNSPNPQQPSTFPSSSTPAFGQPSQPTPSPAFGGQPQSQRQPRPNPFNQPPTSNNTFPTTNPPSQPQTASNIPGTLTPDPSTYLLLTPASEPHLFKTQPVDLDRASKTYFYANAAHGNRAERLWFPAGPPKAANPDITFREEAFYTGQFGGEVERIFRGVADRGGFGGVMPEVPPRVEWVRWDL